MPTYASKDKAEKSAAEQALNWQSISGTFDRRCALIEITGLTNSGRTYWPLMYCPGPIALIDAQEKIDGVAELAVASRGIKIERIGFGEELRGKMSDLQASAVRSRAITEAAITHAYSWARTIVIDTHNSLWDCHQLARIGSLEKAELSEADRKKGQLIYTVINPRWRALWRQFRQMRRLYNRTNMVLIGEMKPIFVDDGSGYQKDSGRKTAQRQKHLFQDMDVVLETTKVDGEYGVIIRKGWFNNGLYEGVELTGKASRFPEVMGLITNTEPKQWR